MKAVLFLVVVAGLPHTAFAQSVIAGTVTDSFGAPIAGVTVAASSPELIEKIRTTATDNAGRYRIENLRPGTYVVTFTLDGWSPLRREGIELAGSFTATIDVQLAIGRLTDLITVAGATPIVDVHSATREVTLSSEVVRSIPTVRSYLALIVLVPGVVTSGNDVVTGTATQAFPIHGGRANESRLLLDGLTIGSPPSGNSATSYTIDVGQAREVTFTSGGASGELETAGLVMNIVPKTGGNVTHGSLFASGSGEGLQGDNLTPALREQGVLTATPLTKVYDISGTLGGPIVLDRAWYFVNAHTGGSTKASANVFYNTNAGNPGTWLYSPDHDRPAYSDRTFENASARVTWQVTPRNKVGAFWDKQVLCRKCTGATPGNAEPQRSSPEATGILGRPLDVVQATWSSPVTDRLLLEAGFGGVYFGVGNFERKPNVTRDLVRVIEQCASGCAENGGLPGLAYRSQDFSTAYTGSYLWKGALSRITGRHSLKIGYQHTLMTDDRTWMTNDQNVTYRFNNGMPNQLTQSISPWMNNARAGWDAVFVQDQWTHDRLTLHAAMRFDRARSWFPAQQEGPSRFLPTPIVIPRTTGVDSYKDLTPRMGAAYDVFGNGKTAIAMNLGRYLEGMGVTGNYANTNPTLRMPQTTPVFGTAGVTRAWTDANGNYVADCDLLNPAAQDLRATGGDLCGVMSNIDFGKNILTNNFDRGVLNGWGVRPSDWNLGISLNQQIHTRASLGVTYVRRWYNGFFVADNLSLEPADLTPFGLTAPLDPRLPGGGGYLVSGLYDVVPDKAGQVSNLVTNSSNYGQWSQHFNGIDASVTVRNSAGLTLGAGTSTGQTVADNCHVRARLPELATTVTGTSAFGAGVVGSAVTPVSPYCHVAYGILTQARGLGSYLIPGIDLQVSATFQSKPGAMLAADYAAPNSVVTSSLGRNLSGNAPNVTVNLVAPGAMYGDRINQLDVRLAKTFRYGRSRTMVAFDLYNVLNSSTVLTYNTAFVPGGTWLQPMTILTPRFARFTAEFEF
jgi:hypothetical protein